MANEPKKLILCLDGTWNNPHNSSMRDDGSEVFKPSNSLKMARAILPWNEDEGAAQVTYYDAGVGSLGTYPGLSNKLVGLVDKYLGGFWGAGFEANIEQAATFLANNYLPGDQVFIFGFSRGAAEARGLTRFLDWMGGIPTKHDAYFVPKYYRAFMSVAGNLDPGEVKSSIDQALSAPIVPIEIDLLGVWETVMALGSRFLANKSTSVQERSFYVGEKPAKCVRHARQALAIDEKRYDFRPEIWSEPENDQTLQQRWFAGVHSNIGGGYVDDGLANIAFLWLLKEAQKLGLATDKNYTKYYAAYLQDRLYNSRNLSFKAQELLFFKRGKGIRKITGRPDSAGLTLDKTVIQRIIAQIDKKKHPQLELYRPANVIAYLKTRKADLPEFFNSIGLDPDTTILPPDVQKAL